MKIRVITVLLVMIALCNVASAQSYAIRVTYNTNLRAANSLTSGVVESAPAGTVLTVLGQQGRWLQIDRSGRQVWMAGWVSHSRVQSAQPAVSQPQSQPQTPIDNCCFVDRQCHTDQEWADGYWAFQNGQCAAPAQSQPQVQAQPQTQAQTQTQTWVPTQRGNPHDIDNCCQLDRECHSDEEWRAGWVAFKELECWDEYHKWARTPDPRYMPASGSDNCCNAPGWLCLNDEHFHFGLMAFQDYGHCNPQIKPYYLPSVRYYDATDNCCHLGRQCQTEEDWAQGYSDFLHFRCEFNDIPLFVDIPVHIEGSPSFTAMMKAAFSLLKAKSPYYYDYAIRGLDKIRQESDGDPLTSGGHVTCEDKTYVSRFSDSFLGDYTTKLLQEASIIVHEACHCNLKDAGFIAPKPWPEGKEVPCYEQQHLVLRQLDPHHGLVAGYSNQVVSIVRDYPWFASYLEKPLSYHQHFLAVGP
ncbi:MAG: SH3 domain-containing protein [Chloroflexi bacterium]|nr:SH3 domain-containing protein [Chloroflexota bacterium]